MFNEIAGLPAHPLLVHAAVVLAPGLALVAIGYAVVPAVRAYVEGPLIVLAVGAPLAVATARESGAVLQRRLIQEEMLTSDMLGQIESHASSARILLLITLGLGALSFGWIFFEPTRQSEASAVVLAIVTCVLGVTLLWFAIRTGHTGTSMVWGGAHGPFWVSTGTGLEVASGLIGEAVAPRVPFRPFPCSEGCQ